MTTPRRFPSLSVRRRKEIASLAVKKYREKLGEMLIEGMRSVQSAVDGGAPVREIVIAEGMCDDPRLAAILEASDVPVFVASDMSALSDVEATQGILAVAAIEILPAARLLEFDRVLALDGLQDPGNVGTIVRTAAWFGVEGVVSGAGTVDLHNPKAVRSAMGGLWEIKHTAVTDLVSLLEEMRRAGFTIYGAEAGGEALDGWRPAARSVLVLGSEAHGVSPEVRAVLDASVGVPPAPGRRATESLNVGVAAGILLHEWTKNTRSTRGGRG